MENKVSILAAVLSIVLAIGLMLVLIFAFCVGLHFALQDSEHFRDWLWVAVTASAVLAFVAASVFGNWLQKRRTSHQHAHEQSDQHK